VRRRPIRETSNHQADLMRLWNWLRERFSAQGKMVARYQRGLSSARRHAHSDAIADYDAVIVAPASPPDLVSMARYNRALVNAATGNVELAEHELRAVIALGETPINVRTAARHKLARMSHSVLPRRR
jgi:hypothetical protein